MQISGNTEADDLIKNHLLVTIAKRIEQKVRIFRALYAKISCLLKYLRVFFS